jgi:hypothetical protein
MLLTLLKATGGAVTASFVGIARTPSDGTDATGATLALTIPAGTSVDDYAVAIIELWDSTATNPTLTYPSGFSEIVSYVSTTDGFQKMKVAVKKLTAADSGTYSVSGFGSHFRQGHVAIIRGIDTTTALDVAVNLAQNSTGTTLPANSLTTVTAGCLIMRVVANENTSTGTPDTGYTEQADSNYLKTNTKIAGSAGTETPSGGSQSVSNLKLSALIAFRPAADSGITGTIAAIQAGNTSAATGQLGYSGTVAAVQANNTAAASGKLGYSGSIAATQANQTAAASGTVGSGISGTIAATQAANTAAASGQLGYSGTIASTQANQTAVASGKLGYTGTAAPVQANQTAAISGTFTSAGSFTGTIAATQANQTATATGKLGYSGTIAAAQASNTASATGTVINPTTGTIAATQANQTAAVAGKLGYTGVIAVGQGSNTASIQGTFFIPITGVIAATQANQTANASGTALGSVVIRPNTGTTSRPGSGRTTRPLTGVTPQP